MAPPISYFNTPWGRANAAAADFDDATSLSRACCHTPPQPPSSSPPPSNHGSIPSLRLYHNIAFAARARGFPPPSRSSVEFYAARALPAPPTSSVGSVEEMVRDVSPPSPAESVFSAREVPDWRGRGLCGVQVRLRRKDGVRDLQVGLGRRESETLPAVVADAGMLMFPDEEASRSPSMDTRSTVDSEVETLLTSPPTGSRWVQRMRKRAHWTLRWFEQYRED